MRQSRLEPSRIAQNREHPTQSSDGYGRSSQTGTPNFWNCQASHAEKRLSPRLRANGTTVDHMTALQVATAGKPAQTREHCTSSKNLVVKSDHPPFLLFNAF